MTSLKSKKIQILRGISIVAVVLIHCTPLGTAQIVARPFLNFSVGLFLFLSGMLSNAEKWRPRKRLVKILVPYVIWSFIYVTAGNIHSPELIPVAFLKALLTANSAGMMYFVFVYCELTLLIPLLDKLARSKYCMLGFFFSPLEIIVMRLLPILLGIEMHPYVGLIISLSCIGWFSYFYLGYLLGNNLMRVSVSEPRLLMIIAALIAIQMAEGYWYASMGIVNCGTQLKLSALFAGQAVCCWAFMFVNSTSRADVKLFHLLGDYSFGIFYSHMLVISLLQQTPVYSMLVYPANGLVVTGVSLLIVLVGHRALESKSWLLAC